MLVTRRSSTTPIPTLHPPILPPLPTGAMTEGVERIAHAVLNIFLGMLIILMVCGDVFFLAQVMVAEAVWVAERAEASTPAVGRWVVWHHQDLGAPLGEAEALVLAVVIIPRLSFRFQTNRH